MVGYNPASPAVPRTATTGIMIANLRLVLDVDVHDGDEQTPKHGQAGPVGVAGPARAGLLAGAASRRLAGASSRHERGGAARSALSVPPAHDGQREARDRAGDGRRTGPSGSRLEGQIDATSAGRLGSPASGRAAAPQVG